MTVQIVTMMLLRSAPPMLPSTHAVRKAPSVRLDGQVPSPLIAMSSKLRSDTRITNRTGRIHRKATGPMTAWNTQPCFFRRRTGAGAVALSTRGRAGAMAMSVLFPGGADQVGDDEGDGEHEDHAGDPRAVAEVHEAEADLVHVRAQQLRAVVRAAASHRPDDVEGAQRVDHRDREDDSVDVLQLRQHHEAEPLPGARAVDRGSLLQGRVAALQPGQVQHHDVAGL